MDGILLIDKPAGMTSHDVVDVVRRVAKTRRVGHAGTLDPFATGLLILGIGKATKELNTYVGLEKTYEAVARLGATSTTEDPEGEITDHKIDDPPSAKEVDGALAEFRGGYLQTAPAFSAKKIRGKKLYELARKGKIKDVELPKKDVKISELTIVNYDWPSLTFLVNCSSGTYIRSLAKDIGERLGTGAYLTNLCRTKIGDFDVTNSIQLNALDEDSLKKNLRM